MSLTLKDILLDFPHVSIASEGENAELLSFYHQTELAAKTNTIIYNRGENFFQFLKERSDHYLVFILRDDSGKIQGVGVASFRPGFIKGEITNIGYLGDLRVNMNRKLIREWRKFYGALLEKSPELPETYFCRHYQTALMSENRYSKINLADTKIANLLYKELAGYQMINIIGTWGINFNQGLTARWSTPEDTEELISFLQADHELRLFGHDWTKELERRLKNWQNFSINDFIIVKDNDDKTIAVTSVWNPIKSKQIIVQRIPFLFKAISLLASKIPGIKLKPLPKEMEPIEILYLNQISFAFNLSQKEKVAAFKLIVDLAFSRRFNILAYCDFDREGLSVKAKNLITQKNHLGLYSVHFKNNDGQVRDELFLKPEDLSPAFDMSLV